MPDEDEYTVYQTDDGVRHGYGEIVLITDSREQLAQSVAAAALAGYTIKEVDNAHALIRWFQSLQSGPDAGNAPAPPLPKPAAAAPAPSEAKPVAGETAQTLAAPDIKTASDADATALVDHVASDTRVSPIDAPDMYASRSAPRPADEIADMLVPAPATRDEYQAAITSTERNFAAVPGERHPTHGAPFARVPATAGEPVDLFTGAMTIDVTDLIVPTATIPIRFQRSYRSGRPYFGPFGYGWDHNHNLYLRELNDGAVALWTGQLREQTFAPDADSWKPEDGLAARLERAPDAPETFDVVHPGGTRWRFARPPDWGSPERIPLTRIADRHGNLVTFTYDSSDRLESVLDEAGRGLRFTYGSCGLLEAVSDHTQTRVVTYEHHEEIEHLVRVLLPATAEFPSGVPTTYDYDLYADHPAMRHNILRIADARGRTYLENEYAGPEAGWAFNTVTRQLAGGFEYRFDFEQIQFVAPDAANLGALATRTSVAPPDGSLHVYTFNYRGDLLDHRFRLNRDGSYRVIAEQFSYDAAGNRTEAVGPDGLRQITTYDAANPDPCARRNLLRIELAAALPGLAPSRTLLRAQYDPRYQQPVRLIDEAGQQTRLVYDFDAGLPAATGRVMRVELPPATLADGSLQHAVTHLEHNTCGQVTVIVSPEGSRTLMEYVAGGIHDGLLRRVIEDQSVSALITEYEYDAAGYPRRVTAPAGRVTELRHNLLGQLEELTPPAVDGQSSPHRVWFGDDGSAVRVERPRGDYTDTLITEPFFTDSFERDVLGRPVVARLAMNTAHGRVLRQRVDQEGRAVSETDPAGVVTERRFDERGALLRETHAPGTPDEASTRYSYDRAGRLVEAVDAAGWVTAVRHDAWGRVSSAELPSGAVSKNRWGAGDLLMEATVEGRPRPGFPSRMLSRDSYEYDERKRLRTKTTWSFVDDPATAVALSTRYRYDMEDRVRSVELPRGFTLGFAYDGLGRLTQQSNPHGTTYDSHYDAAGDMDEVTVTEREGGAVRRASWTYEHDARGRLRAVEAPTGRAEFDHDDRNEIVERREPGGVTIRFSQGPFGEPTESLLDPAGMMIRSQWAYDQVGRLARYTDPTGAETTWEHDRLGRVRLQTLPDGSRWRSDFDLATHRIEHTTPAGTRVSRVLDANNQPTRLECVAAPGINSVPTHEFGYDALGRLVLATQPVGSVERRYDSLGRLVEEITSGGSVRAEYDDATGATDLIYPDGRRERTEHDPGGRPTRVHLVTPGALGGTSGEVLAEISYAGRPASVTYPNGVLTSLAYDDLARLVRIEHSLAGVLLDAYRARYDERGRRAIVQVAGAPAGSTLHLFDAGDRLREARWGFPLPPLPDVAVPADHAAAIAAATAEPAVAGETYLLDEADGRIQRVRSTAGLAPAFDTNVLGPDHRIVTADGHPITYHTDGHRRTDADHSYDVDALGRVVRVRDAANGMIRAEFVYDALSRAATGSFAGEMFARCFWGTTWVQDTRGVAGDFRQCSPHPLWPQALCMIDNADTLFVHQDGGLSTMCVTDQTGAVRERHRYGPFGAPDLFAGDGVTPLSAAGAVIEPMWRGMPLARSIGLYVSPQRLYDPELGVFLAPDPMLYADSPALYVYAAHNPVDFADPTGFAKSPLGAAAPPSAPGSAEQRTGLSRWLNDDSKKGGWFFPPREGDVFTESGPVDTGSTAGNYAINTWISVSNMVKGIINTPFEMMSDLDHAMKRSRFRVEWQNLQSMGPLMGAMGLAVEAPEASAALIYLRGLMPTGKGLGNTMKMFAFMPVSIGGGGGLLLKGKRLPTVDPPVYTSVDPAQAMQGMMDTVVGRFGSNPKLAGPYLSKGEFNALMDAQAHARMGDWSSLELQAPTLFGKVLERSMTRAAGDLGLLEHAGQLRDARGRFISSPDWNGLAAYAGSYFEGTTNAALYAHMARGYPATTIFLTYDIPVSWYLFLMP